MCFSDATPGGEVEPKKKKYIRYSTGGRICFLFFSSPPPYTCIYFFVFCLTPPLLPVRRKCAECDHWGLDRCQCQVQKKWNTWGQVQGTPGGEVKIQKGDK